MIVGPNGKVVRDDSGQAPMHPLQMILQNQQMMVSMLDVLIRCQDPRDVERAVEQQRQDQDLLKGDDGKEDS